MAALVVPDDVWRHILSSRTDIMREEMRQRQRVQVGYRSFQIQSMSVRRPSDFWTSQHIYINVHCQDERGKLYELRTDFFHYSCLGEEDKLLSMSVCLHDDVDRDLSRCIFSARWGDVEASTVPVSVMGMDLASVFHAMYDSSPTAVLRRILKETNFHAKSTRTGDAFVYDASA